MKTRIPHLFATAAALLLSLSASSLAKDKPVRLEECPAPVQAVIKQYQTQAQLEEIGLDEKKKSGGPAVYEAKFALPDGRRIEIHISPEGTVILMEEKKRKN